MSGKRRNNLRDFNIFAAQYNGQGLSKKELGKLYQNSKNGALDDEWTSMDCCNDSASYISAGVDVFYAWMIQLREHHFNSSDGILKNGEHPDLPQKFSRQEIFDVMSSMTPQEKKSMLFKVAGYIEEFNDTRNRVSAWENELPMDSIYSEAYLQRTMDDVRIAEDHSEKLFETRRKESRNEVLMKREIPQTDGGVSTIEHIHATRDALTMRSEKGMRHTFSAPKTTTTANAKETSTIVEQTCVHEEYSRFTTAFSNRERNIPRGVTTVTVKDAILKPNIDNTSSVGGLRSTIKTVNKSTFDEQSTTKFPDGSQQQNYKEHRSWTSTTTDKKGLLRDSLTNTVVNEKGEVLASSNFVAPSRHVAAAKDMAIASAAATVFTETIRLGVAAHRYSKDEISGKERAKEVGGSAIKSGATIAVSAATGFFGSCAKTLAEKRLPVDLTVKGLGTVKAPECSQVAVFGAVAVLCTVATEKLLHDETVSGPRRSNTELAGTCLKQLTTMSVMSLEACKVAGKGLKGSGAAVGALATIEAVSTVAELYNGTITKKEAAGRVATSAIVTAAGCVGTCVGTALTPVGAGALVTVGLPVVMSVGCAMAAGFAIGKAWSWWSSGPSSNLKELEAALELTHGCSFTVAKQSAKALLLRLHPDKLLGSNGVDVDGKFVDISRKWEEYCVLRGWDKMDHGDVVSLGARGRKAWADLLVLLKRVQSSMSERSRQEILLAIEDVD